MDQRTNNDLQNITQKTRDQASLNCAPERIAALAPYVALVHCIIEDCLQIIFFFYI